MLVISLVLEATVPLTSNRHRNGVVPGWTEEVALLRQNSMFWHNLWVDCGRNHCGAVADIMRRTRATYHYAVRSVRKREQEIVNDRFATALLSHKDRDFWSEVKRIRAHKTCQSNMVDKQFTPDSIADYFAHKYEDLYSSVSYSVDDNKKISDELNTRIVRSGFNDECAFSLSLIHI